jgi:malonate transporter and related proteins
VALGTALDAAVLFKLGAIGMTVALGWIAGRWNWLGEGVDRVAATRLLSSLAFTVFVPALLFRATVQLDLERLPLAMLAAFFVPALALMLLVLGWARRRRQGPEAAAVTALIVTFGNSVQLGIPMAAALLGPDGLALHVALVSLHALVLLVPATLVAELGRARGAGSDDTARHSAWRALAHTLRATLLHPVLLPIIAGFAWNAAGLGLPPLLDELLLLLGAAVVPLCLVLIGLSLSAYGLRLHWRGALGLVAAKLLLLPALVLAFAHGVLGLAGLPLAVVVLMAALPVGANPLIFAQRYRQAEAEATSAIVVSTVLFAGSATLWLAVVNTLSPM